MSGFPSFVDGRLVPAGEPALRADDTGFLLGLSVFDTVLLEDGCLVFLEEHLARLERGAAELGIAWPPPHDPVEALRSVIEAVGGGRPLALRMTLSRGPAGDPEETRPTFVVTPREVSRPADPGVVVALAAERRRAGDPLGRLKSTNRIAYVLAREAAQRAGAFEALFATDEDDLLEGTISNVFCVVDGTLRTPSVERGCLPGTSRARVLAELERSPLELAGRPVPVDVGRVDLADLGRATEVFLTNTTGGVIPVVAVADVAESLPGSEGPVTSRVRERLREAQARYCAERGGAG